MTSGATRGEASSGRDRADQYDDTESRDSRLLRGVRVVDALAVKPMTAAEVARAISTNRSTALRLLHDMDAESYVIRDVKTKRYELAPTWVWGIAANTRAHADIGELLGPILSRIRDDYGEATAFAVPANGSMVYVQHFPARQHIGLHEQLGTARPMNTSALGKAYLSMLDDAEVDGHLGTLDYQQGTSLAARGPMELRERIETARAAGYALDQDETFEGSACVAAPVTINGEVIGAAGCQGPASRLTRKVLDEVGVRLVKDLSSLV